MSKNKEKPPSSCEGKTLLVVNTGSLKKKFILQRIKKLGLNVIVLHKEKNWAQPYVDHWIIADTTNHDASIRAVKNFFQTNNYTLDGVITFWEDDVLLTAKLSDQLHLVGITYETANRVRNKYLFRQFCEEQKLPMPHHLLIQSPDDIKKTKKELSFPMVIKPVYGSSSAYVVRVDDGDELQKTYEYIKSCLSVEIESALSDGSGILVEEYIDGDEVDIDLIVQNGKIKFWSITDNFKTHEPFFVETGESLPSSLPIDRQDVLLIMAEEVLEKIGVQNGCIHFEAKSTKSGAVPIEINIRMGGDEVCSSIKKVWNVDLVECAVKVALGIYIAPIKKPKNPKKYIVGQYFLPPYSGILSMLEVHPELLKKEYVVDFEIFKKVGESVLVPPEGYEYMGWITVSGDTLMDAQHHLQDALKYVHYEISKFHSTSSIGKTVRKSQLSTAKLHSDILLGRAKIEKIRQMSLKDLRELHIGVACNIFQGKDQAVEQELTAVGKNIEAALLGLGYKVSFFDFNRIQHVMSSLAESKVDLVFNVCERINNSSLLEPHAASVFDILQVPYTGSNPFTLGLCIDKIRVKKLLSYHGIPTPRWDYVYDMNDRLADNLRYPLIVKPSNTDNSLGITNDSVVTNKKDLEKQLHKVVVELGSPALVEEYIEGDEYDVSIMGSESDDLRVLPLSRSVFSKMPQGYWHIYPYEAKWSTDPVYKTHIEVQRPPKNVPKNVISLISEIALDTYNIMDCHDYGRVEIRVDKNNNPYVLELNPNPSINRGDCLPSVAEIAGMEYAAFLEEIIRLAIKRYKNRPPYYHLRSTL